MTLSDKRFEDTDNGIDIYAYDEDDVKEFIKELKEDILIWDNQANQITLIIDELAGDKLI